MAGSHCYPRIHPGLPRVESRDRETRLISHLYRGVVLIALFHRWRRRAPRTPENWSISYVLILVFHSTIYLKDYHLPRWGSPAQACPLEPPLQLWGLVVIIVTLCVVEDIEVLPSSVAFREAEIRCESSSTKIASEMELAPRYTLLSMFALLTLLTLFILFTLFILIKLLCSSSMYVCLYILPIYIGRVRTLLIWADELLSKMLGGWSGWIGKWIHT